MDVECVASSSVKPGVSQDEIDRVVESKESVFAQVMFAEAGHAQALSAYQEIEVLYV